MVIWVVKHAREEHKAAVEWLNNHADDKIGFFLCEIKLFQIGDSDIAPSFTVVERPNDWTKEIRKTTATNPTQQQRLEYWQAFNDYAFQNAEFNKAFNKRMVSVLVIVAAVPLFVVAGMFEMQVWARVLLMGIGFAITVMGIAIACVLDREAGAFECPECKERFVPDMKSYVMGPHTITKRKLTCPKCGCTKYCKHVLTR